jgi:hypothetical protein
MGFLVDSSNILSAELYALPVDEIVIALSAANVTALRFKIAISAVMLPSRQRGAPGDLPSLFCRKLGGSCFASLTTTELSKSNSSWVFSRIGGCDFLVDLSRGKIDDELCELVRVSRTLA